MLKTTRDFEEDYIALVKKLKPKKVVEWGPGLGIDTSFKNKGEYGNTQIVLDNSNAEIISIEHQKQYLPKKNIKRLDVRFVENIDTPDYINIPEGWEDADLFFVDARNRSQCLDYIKENATKRNYVACIHDAERAWYKDAIHRFKYVLYTNDEQRFCIMTNNKQKFNQIKKIFSS